MPPAALYPYVISQIPYSTVVVVRNWNLPSLMVLMNAISLLASPVSLKVIFPVTPSISTFLSASRIAAVSVEPASSMALMAAR